MSTIYLTGRKRETDLNPCIKEGTICNPSRYPYSYRCLSLLQIKRRKSLFRTATASLDSKYCLKRPLFPLFSHFALIHNISYKSLIVRRTHYLSISASLHFLYIATMYRYPGDAYAQGRGQAYIPHQRMAAVRTYMSLGPSFWPHSFDLASENTALMVVDMQVDCKHFLIITLLHQVL